MRRSVAGISLTDGLGESAGAVSTEAGCKLCGAKEHGEGCREVLAWTKEYPWVFEEMTIPAFDSLVAVVDRVSRERERAALERAAMVAEGFSGVRGWSKGMLHLNDGRDRDRAIAQAIRALLGAE